MKKSIIARAGSVLVAAALVGAGSLLVAAPASADEGDYNLTLENDTFAAGNWGAGISLTASGLPANIEVQISAGAGNGSSGDSWGQTTVTSDDTGAVALNGWIPQYPPFDMGEGYTASVGLSFSVGEDEYNWDSVQLTITPFVPNAPSFTIDPTSILLADATNPEGGFSINATGFNQYEDVTVTVVGPNGEPLEDYTDDTYADGTGSIIGDGFYFEGDIITGTYTLTLTGADSGVVVSAQIVVVSPTAPAAAPELAATGADATPALAGGALMLLAGAAFLLMRRRAVAAQR